jgi:hypothetical protein
MAAQDTNPDPDIFRVMKRKVRRTLLIAFESVSFALFYPDADVTIQIRNGKYRRLEIREIDESITA